MIGALARVEGKIDDLGDRMERLEVRVGGVERAVDGLTRKVDDFSLRWAVHEDRITRLEKRRPS